MWFFKRKEKDPKEKYYQRAWSVGIANSLSDAQIKTVIQNNQDLDFLIDELKEQMNYPDIMFLLQKYVPPTRRIARKPIDVQRIVEGVICGDIIGSKFEFTEHDYAEAYKMTIPARKSFHTDDTVLTRATYQAILDNPEHPDFRQAYINAYHKEKGAGYGSSFVHWAEMKMETGYHSYANGCVMRIAPIAAYYDDLTVAAKHAVASCMTTHDHVESVKGTIVFTVCMWMALHGYQKNEIFEYCAQAYQSMPELIYKNSHFDMHHNLCEIPNNISKSSLFTNYAVPFVVKCFAETEDYEACMREILAHYGDTDTLCAMAGGLCVAFYGTTGMDNQAILDADLHKI